MSSVARSVSGKQAASCEACGKVQVKGWLVHVNERLHILLELLIIIRGVTVETGWLDWLPHLREAVTWTASCAKLQLCMSVVR